MYNFGNEDVHDTPNPPQVQDATPKIPDVTTLISLTVLIQEQAIETILNKDATSTPDDMVPHVTPIDLDSHIEGDSGA